MASLDFSRFFSKYSPTFQYDSRQSPTVEFERLVATLPQCDKSEIQQTRQSFLLVLWTQNSMSKNPVAVFFSAFREFDYDPLRQNVNPRSEFNRLAVSRNWSKKGLTYKTHLQYFNIAVKRQEIIVGLNEGSVEGVSFGLGKLAIGDVNTTSGDAPGGNPTSSVVNFRPSKGHGPLDKFFQGFTTFQYNPSTRSELEFRRLCRHEKWNPKKQKYQNVRSRFFRAVGEEVLFHLTRPDLFEDETEEETSGVLLSSGEFDTYSRSAMSSSRDPLYAMEPAEKPWRRLCEVLGILAISGHNYPDSITQCRKALKSVYINIFDFVHYLREGESPLKRHPTLAALSQYSYAHRRVFPLQAAKESEILKFLLRAIGFVA